MVSVGSASVKMAKEILPEFPEMKPHLRITEMNYVSMILTNCTYITQWLHLKTCICLRAHFKIGEFGSGCEEGHLEGSLLWRSKFKGLKLWGFFSNRNDLWNLFHQFSPHSNFSFITPLTVQVLAGNLPILWSLAWIIHLSVTLILKRLKYFFGENV